MSRRWKTKEIESMDSIQFAITILNERKNKLTNPYSPLCEKLATAVRDLEGLKKVRDEDAAKTEAYNFWHKPQVEATKISYLYRDGSNYKVYNEVILAGRLTSVEKQTILDSLYESDSFIPSVVGLPEEKFGTETDDDMPFFELTKDDFEDVVAAVTPWIDFDVHELVMQFAAARDLWEKYAFTG